MNEQGPETLIDAVRYFSDKQMCEAYMVGIKWPDGKIACPRCQSDNVGVIATRGMFKCRACKKQFSSKVGTIFEDSPLPLSSWFVAVWMIANTKNGTSSCELARHLGVTQKTAWFMLHRIRLAMRTGTFRKLHGVVESDETFVGGRAANMHKKERDKKITGRGGIGKTIVHGLLERGDAASDTKSQVRATVVPNTDAETLMPEIARNVERTAVVCTDAAAAYAGLESGFVHRFIDHATKYVEGKVHVNGLENFWTLLKRMLKGTYVAVAPFHLFRYLDEESWRFNERGTNDGGRFARVMRGVLGRRITYRQLCAIEDCGFMGAP
jgi:transposase-like protein